MYSVKRKKYNDKILKKELLCKEYIMNKTKIQNICQKYSVSEASIYRKLKKFNIKLRGHNNKGKNNPMFGIHRTGKNNPNWNSILIECLICHKKFYICQYKLKLTENICCSRKCASELKQKIYEGKGNPNWRNGSSFEPYPLGWNKTFKEQIRYRDKYKCQICGCPEVECYRKLDVHHKDYDKMNISPDNLVSLCQSCHMKTNGNRDYWISYFKEVQGVNNL